MNITTRLDTVSSVEYILLVANRNALIASVISRTNSFEAAELAGETDRLAMLEVGLTDAEADCYTAGLTDADIWGQLTDTAVSL